MTKSKLQQLMPDGTWADMDGNPCEEMTGEFIVVTGEIVHHAAGEIEIFRGWQEDE